MNTRDCIEFSGVSKSINGRHLFQHLHLKFNPGECVVLSGDNGEGKTTLLRIMSGLLHPDDGNCQYNGIQLSWQRARPWLLKNVVYLHQAPYLFDASVEANITYGLRRHGMRRKAARAMATDAIQRAGLVHLQQRSGKQLSGGERQRVALLRAWVLSPRLLLLDEPTASMDERARHTTLFLVRWLLQDGVSLVITAHEPRLFAPLADRHIKLQHGELNVAPPLTSVPSGYTDPMRPTPEGHHDGQHYQ
jgi:tungstate transport system ATP-binding protein